jgi:hypothetical protein
VLRRPGAEQPHLRRRGARKEGGEGAASRGNA